VVKPGAGRVETSGQSGRAATQNNQLVMCFRHGRRIGKKATALLKGAGAL